MEYPELDAHFGEQGGLLTYGTYLRLPELLDLACRTAGRNDSRGNIASV